MCYYSKRKIENRNGKAITFNYITNYGVANNKNHHYPKTNNMYAQI